MMFTVNIEIVGRLRSIVRPALIDSGTSGGLVIPKSIVKKLGLTLTEPERFPRDASGSLMRGMASIAVVRICGIEVETLIFCPNSKTSEVLVGCHVLKQGNAMMTIGQCVHYFNQSRQNPSPAPPTLNPYDLSDWEINLQKPVTPWW